MDRRHFPPIARRAVAFVEAAHLDRKVAGMLPLDKEDTDQLATQFALFAITEVSRYIRNVQHQLIRGSK